MSREKEIIVGGQAVMEGVMMRAPNSYAVAVRRQDGTIVSKSERLPKLSDKYPILRMPILRGGAVLIHSMLLGLKAINFSASVAFDDLAADEKKKAAVQAATATGALLATAHSSEATHGQMAGIGAPAKSGGRSESEKEPAASLGTNSVAVGSIVFMLFFNIFLFIVLPFLLTNMLFIASGWENQASPEQVPATDATWYQAIWIWIQPYLQPVRPSIAFNLVDGVIRMIFFILMIYGFSRLSDIKRIFEYHGAEHKTVYAWEAGDELTVANAKRYPRQHPRCGTSFLMVVMLVSIVLFSLIKFDSLILNMLMRIVLMPLIAGLSYEIIRAAGSKETSRIFSIITRPDIWLQNLTTKEPSEEQLEVAIYALNESLKLEPQN
jgi:uncharacterized protein YqhQ